MASKRVNDLVAKINEMEDRGEIDYQQIMSKFIEEAKGVDELIEMTEMVYDNTDVDPSDMIFDVRTNLLLNKMKDLRAKLSDYVKLFDLSCINDDTKEQISNVIVGIKDDDVDLDADGIIDFIDEHGSDMQNNLVEKLVDIFLCKQENRHQIARLYESMVDNVDSSCNPPETIVNYLTNDRNGFDLDYLLDFLSNVESESCYAEQLVDFILKKKPNCQQAVELYNQLEDDSDNDDALEKIVAYVVGDQSGFGIDDLMTFADDIDNDNYNYDENCKTVLKRLLKIGLENEKQQEEIERFLNNHSDIDGFYKELFFEEKKKNIQLVNQLGLPKKPIIAETQRPQAATIINPEGFNREEALELIRALLSAPEKTIEIVYSHSKHLFNDFGFVLKLLEIIEYSSISTKLINDVLDTLDSVDQCLEILRYTHDISLTNKIYKKMIDRTDNPETLKQLDLQYCFSCGDLNEFYLSKMQELAQ